MPVTKHGDHRYPGIQEFQNTLVKHRGEIIRRKTLPFDRLWFLLGSFPTLFLWYLSMQSWRKQMIAHRTGSDTWTNAICLLRIVWITCNVVLIVPQATLVLRCYALKTWMRTISYRNRLHHPTHFTLDITGTQAHSSSGFQAAILPLQTGKLTNQTIISGKVRTIQKCTQMEHGTTTPITVVNTAHANTLSLPIMITQLLLTLLGVLINLGLSQAMWLR